MKIFYTITVLLLTLQVNAQLTIDWVRTYNGQFDYWDEPSAMVLDTFGNVYVTGVSAGNGSMDSYEFEYVTIKYNVNGLQQWIKRYNRLPNQTDEATCIAIDKSGNIIVSGTSCEYTSAPCKMATLKYSPDGNLLWESVYGPGLGWDVPIEIETDFNNNIYIAGQTDDTLTDTDLCLLKYNSSGNLIWSRVLNTFGNNRDEMTACQLDNKGNIIYTGYINDYISGNKIITVKYDTNGVHKWTQIYDSPLDTTNISFSITVDNNGNSYVGSYAKRGLSWFIKILKYTPTGDLLWVKEYPGPKTVHEYHWGSTESNPVKLFFEGTKFLYFASTVFNSANNSDDIYAVKMDTSGNTLWSNSFHSENNNEDVSRAVTLDNYGNLYVTGWSYYSPLTRGKDFTTIKFDSSGYIKWSIFYDGNSIPHNNDDIPVGIAINKFGNVIVSGLIQTANRDDYCTIQYSQPIGIQPLSNEVPEKFSLSQNYPNPFNPVTTIKFNIPVVSFNKGLQPLVQLKVYDILGREVQTPVNETLKAGTYEVEFDGSNLGSGVYYFILTAGDFKESIKMVLIK